MLTLVSPSGRVIYVADDATLEVLDASGMPTEVAVARSIRRGECVRMDAESRPLIVRGRTPSPASD